MQIMDTHNRIQSRNKHVPYMYFTQCIPGDTLIRGYFFTELVPFYKGFWPSDLFLKYAIYIVALL